MLFTSGRAAFTGAYQHLFTVPVEGGVEAQLPIPNAYQATYSPDGRRIAYNPLPPAYDQWKQYRGGRVSRLWLYNTADHAVEKVPQPADRANDVDPMWVGGAVYFRSDRDGEFNVYAYDTASKQVRTITRHEDFPVLKASAGGGKIVYEQAGWLHLLDPASGSAKRLVIPVPADLRETRARFVKGPDYIRSAGISPAGARAVFEFRGEIVTVPAEKGDARNITGSVAAHERSPQWSPDGSRIAYFSDASGEYELHVASHDGKGDVKKYKLDWRRLLRGPALVARQPEDRVCGQLPVGPLAGPGHRGDEAHRRQPDLQPDQPAGLRLVARFEVAGLRRQHAGPGEHGVRVLDRPGQVVRHHRRPERSGRTRLRQGGQVSLPLRVDRRRPAAGLVRAVERGHAPPAERLPGGAAQGDRVAAREGERRGEAEEDRRAGGEARRQAGSGRREGRAGGRESRRGRRGEEGRRREEGAVRDRLRRHREPHRRPARFRPGTSTTCRPARPASCSTSASMAARVSLHRFDLAKRKDETPLASVDSYLLSADAKKVLYAKDRAWFITAAGPKIAPGEGKIATGDIEVRIDPRAEWTQIFNEAWRVNRDYFYAPNMHGVDWPAMKAKYAAFLPDVATRGDLNRVIQWMCSELAVGHHRGGGGDRLEQAKTVPGGLLGADYDVANGRYRFKRVLGGLNWTPDLRSPLTEPGVDVKAGEYLISVNGRDVRPPANLYSFFENTSGKIVELTVGPNADGTGSRTVQAVPIASESALRNRDWVEGNLKKVDKATGGRVAYVYVPNTAGARPHLLQALLLSPGPQGRRHRRRALQRRRPGGRLLHRHPAAALHQQLGDALRRRPEDADRVHPGAEGDDHRRDGRLGRRPAAVDVPQVQGRDPRGPAHLGRTRRRARLPDPDGRRIDHGAEPRHLGARRRAGSSRTRACRPTSRWSRRRPT